MRKKSTTPKPRKHVSAEVKTSRFFRRSAEEIAAAEPPKQETQDTLKPPDGVSDEYFKALVGDEQLEISHAHTVYENKNHLGSLLVLSEMRLGKKILRVEVTAGQYRLFRVLSYAEAQDFCAKMEWYCRED